MTRLLLIAVALAFLGSTGGARLAIVALPELPEGALHVEVPEGTREVAASELRTRRTLVER